MSEFLKNPNNILSTYEGLRAEVNLFGGYLENFTDIDGNDLLFPRQDLGGKDRGGVPVCAPIFGPGESVGLKQHGFARNLLWEGQKSEGPNEIKLTLVNPRSQDETLPEEYEGCAMELSVRIGTSEDGDSRLGMNLRVRNYGPKSFVLSPGFHPYLPLEDGDEIEKIALAEPDSQDFRQYTAKEYAEVQYPPFASEKTIIAMHGKQVEITTAHLPALVAWSANPDMYVCIEPTATGVLDVDKVAENMFHTGQERNYSMSMVWKKQ